ncbi:MAG: MarR family winged helix-turn-helix transcriptional regulator [Solirubrobacteraceae bacterium]
MSRSPVLPPIGLRLARTAHAATQAFERAMAAAGGSVSAWQVLVLVRSGQCATQADMARVMGITGATVTHHLNALERQGLVRRWREEGNRRVQQVELTEAGLTMFDRLRDVAIRHDVRLRSRLTEGETADLAALLEKLAAGLDDEAGAADAPGRRSPVGDQKGTGGQPDAWVT